MKVIVVYKEGTEMVREAEEWIRIFEQVSGREVERINPDSKEGEAFCEARGIMIYPTVVTVGDEDGKVFGQWSGSPMPVVDEVLGYLVR